MIDTVCCPACQRALRVPNDLLGQQVKCPACEQTFTASDLQPAAWRPPGRHAEQDVEDRAPPPPEPARPRSRPRHEDEEEEPRRRPKPARPDKRAAERWLLCLPMLHSP